MKPANARASSRRPAAIRAATPRMYAPATKRRRPQGQNGTFSGAIRRHHESGQVDPLDVAQRHLQEARPEIAEGLGVPGAEEPVGPLFVAGS